MLAIIALATSPTSTLVSAASAMIASIDWHAYRPLHESRRRRPLLARLGIADSTAAPVAAATSSGPDLLTRLGRAPAEARRDVLVDFVSGEVAKVLGLDPKQPVATQTGLFDLGMDSLMSVELKGRLERGTGQRLPATLTFNYPNVAALATFLMKRLPDPAAASNTPQAAPCLQPIHDLVAAGGADLDELSDDELEARLVARLEQAQ